MNCISIKDKLKNGEVSLGSWMQLPSSDVAEIMGASEYDWVAVDMEHGTFTQSILPDIIRALELGGTSPFVRVAQVTAKDIKHALEAGASGLIYPMISSANQLRTAISWSSYPPIGTRGVGYSRANLFGKNFEKYRTKEAVDIFKVAQLEHINAVSDIDEILQVEGLDAVMVGPYDLSSSMGLTGKFEHPDFKKVMNKILLKAKQYNIPMGTHIVKQDPKQLSNKIAEGYKFIAYCTDAIFLYKNSICPIINK